MNFICQVFVCAVLTLWPLVGLASSDNNGGRGATAASNSNDVITQGSPVGTPAAAAPGAANAMSDGARSGANAQDIPPGTRITTHNWQQYREFMPDGMVELFEGKYFWKMPADAEMEVGPTVIHPLPPGYLAATEKYSSQVRLVTLPDGGLTLENYTGGEPFPNPGEPHKGWKILANHWFRYFPHLVVNTPESQGFQCTQDSFGSISCQKNDSVYRQLSYNTDSGVPVTIPGGEGKFFTFWTMAEQPEQLRYTATLTIAYTDLTKPESDYIFKPALRQSQRLSSIARCATTGLDVTPDDRRFGFNGNPPFFDAKLLREGKVLSMLDFGTAGANFPQDFDMPLGWPKPSWGKWELRDVYVLDVRRIPSMASNYCYGKRIMYLDKQFYGILWEDLYDSQMRPWKIALIQPIVLKMPGIGLQNSSGAALGHMWDIQREHASYGGPADGHGYPVLINENAPKNYQDMSKYSTPAGLSEVMR
jgi:uncharacterized protein DUF1329